MSGLAYQQERTLQDVEAKFSELAIQQERQRRQQTREADRIARLRRMAEELRHASIPRSYDRPERSYTYPFNAPRTGNAGYGGYASNIRTASGSAGIPRRSNSEGFPRVFVRVDPLRTAQPGREPGIRRSSSGLFAEDARFTSRENLHQDMPRYTESPEPIPRQQPFASGSTPRRSHGRHSQARRPSPARTVSSVATSQVTCVSELNRQGREVSEAPTPPRQETPPLYDIQEENSEYGY